MRYYEDDQVTLHLGDSLEVLRTLPDESVNCVVTSPPYFGLRDYGVEGQYGIEETPAAYVESLRAVFAEARRVLARDGTLWLNVGDSYYSGKGSPTQPDLRNEARRPPARVLDKPGATWARPKSLLGIPWRLAFALQDDGWTLRSDIIWHKANSMPESVADRPMKTHEHVFLFARAARYHFDLDAIRQPHAEATVAAAARARKPYVAPGQRPNAKTRGMADGGANPGDVWLLPTQPFPDAHFAVMPAALAERCILAGSRPGDVVLDPFSGSGTTGLAALRTGRRYVGIDLSEDYLNLSLKTRLLQGALLDECEGAP